MEVQWRGEGAGGGGGQRNKLWGERVVRYLYDHLSVTHRCSTSSILTEPGWTLLQSPVVEHLQSPVVERSYRARLNALTEPSG